MIKSVRYFLLISLLVSITIASAISGLGNYLLDEQVIQPYLDDQLVRISSLVEMLSHFPHQDAAIKNSIIDYLNKTQPLPEQHFFFQVWDEKGNLLIHSTRDQISLRHAKLGFGDYTIGDNDWRVYVTEDSKTHTKMIVGELSNLRHELADDIAHSNANILLITYPVFGLLVWLIISFALRSITRVTEEISSRASTHLEPVQLSQIPVEIKPLVAGLNQLFIRLKHEFERNKRFAADAAHELRTPLAALKTHAQVSLKATNELDRVKALQKVIESVDRSSHVVAQLLTLSRLTEEDALTDLKPFDLHKLAIEIIAYLAPSALEKNIEIELTPPPSHPIILGNDIAIGILIRNIVDNAIRYTPPTGEVKVSIIETESSVIFRVLDTGTGIPLELRERVFERFYRILGTRASGSGLGLAIVSQISELHHGIIGLEAPPNGVGLQFDVAFPKYRA
ncbi:MAG TPA: ATP-binding protein [Gammaproteobacteria bacterium]|jgi:two-component system sensor histidine kinase QseC|nr:ATP-binding protein [Gammaproteobacteria bacterium]